MALLTRARTSIDFAAIVVAILMVATLVVRPTCTQAPTEYEVKAAFLLTFGSFVQWPAATSSEPLVIAVIGSDPFGPTLERLTSKKSVQGRAITIRRLQAGDDVSRAQILFVSASVAERAPDILQKSVTAGVLTVSDIDDFCKMGGVIHLANDNGRIRFDVSLATAQRSGLTLSSKLLGLARSVYREQN